MSLLYKDIDDMEYDIELAKKEDGKILFIASCDGGKFGTDEIIGEYVISVERLIELLEEEEMRAD